MGDLKLIAAFGAFLGPLNMVYMIFFAFYHRFSGQAAFSSYGDTISEKKGYLLVLFSA